MKTFLEERLGKPVQVQFVKPNQLPYLGRLVRFDDRGLVLAHDDRSWAIPFSAVLDVADAE